MQFLGCSGLLLNHYYAVTYVFRLVVCVAMQLLQCSKWLLVLLCSFWGVLGGFLRVTMQLIRCSKCFWVAVQLIMFSVFVCVVMQFLGCSGWLPDCCCAVTKVFWVVWVCFRWSLTGLAQKSHTHNPLRFLMQILSLNTFKITEGLFYEKDKLPVFLKNEWPSSHKFHSRVTTAFQK